MKTYKSVNKKMRSGSFKNVIYKMCFEIIYSIYMYKKDLALDKLHWFICHKTKPNQTKPNHIYLIYMHKRDLALNNLQWLICHKTKPNYILYIWYICIKRIWYLITYWGWDAKKKKKEQKKNQTESYIFDIYVWIWFGIKWPTMVDMP